ncbi:TadG family pilus assembly protein [Methylobacillus pratensis]
MRKTSKENQQGAIGLFGVLTLMMAVLFVAVAVDSGRMWMVKRQLQNVADMAAIAAGGQAGGCGQGGNNNVQQQLIVAAAQSAAMANGYQGDLSSAPNTVQLGTYTTNNDGVRIFQANNNEHRAVRVLATREVPSSLFAGGIFNQRILLRAEAVAAIRTPFATFRVGSTAAAINTAESALLNSLLGRVLQTNIALDVLSYRGLANTNITLLDLVRAGSANGLTVGSVSELLNAPIGLNNFMQLLNVAVNQEGSQASLLGGADRGLVQNALTQLLGTVNNTQIKLGNVLQVSNPDSSAVAATGVNLLSLIQTAAFVANRNNFISLPLGVNLLGLANINTQIQVIEPPQLAIGAPAVAGGTACTIARTAQIKVDTSISTANLLGTSVDLKLSVQVASGRAELRSIVSRGSRTDVTIDTYPGLASVALTNNAGNAPAKINVGVNALGLLGLSLLKADVGLNVPLTQPAPTSLIFDVTHPVTRVEQCAASQFLSQCRTTYAGLGQSLNGLTSSSTALKLNVCSAGISVLGIPLLEVCTDKLIGDLANNVLKDVVTGLVVPLLANVSTMVVDPLLRLLGINIAGATVILDDVNLGNVQPLLR